MTQSSRTFRIFVSSTFSDLKAERNALQEKVFPRLRELAVAHGCRFQAIDLRWGVSEEAALDQQTMKICLGEIERCQKTSPRPNFIILLGDRYGWRPLPYEILADEYENLLYLTTDEEKALLNRWYCRDDNAVPAMYVLQPRTGEFIEYEKWEKVEFQLRTIFQGIISKITLSTEDLLKYTASATEQEIVSGAMKVVDAKEHVFCFLREITDIPNNVDASVFCELDSEAALFQFRLKQKLRESLSDNVHEYTSHWQDNGPSMDHLDQLCNDVYAELSSVILSEVERLDDIDPQDREIANHEIFCNERSRVFIGRNDFLDSINKYLSSTDTHPMVVWGTSGSGKSALMAKVIDQSRNNKGNVIFRFIGATPDSSNGRALLESLCIQISSCYKLEKKEIPSNFTDLIREFSTLLAVANPDQPLYLFLDALDQLTNLDNARNLSWLPTDLPPNVHFLVSTLPGDCLEVIERKIPKNNLINLLPMAAEDGIVIINKWLSDENRTLQKNQLDYILEKINLCGLPLYLKLIFEEAKLWRSYTIQFQLNDNIPGIIRDLLNRFSLESNHGLKIVSHSLGYLSAGKNGLSEDELLDVLSLDEEVLTDFQHRSPKSPIVDRLPFVIWSRLFFDLEPFLCERSADGTTLIGFYHRQMAEACQEMYLNSNRHQHLAQYFSNLPLYLSNNRRNPNIRKVSELPYQLAQSGMAKEKTITLLSDLDFINAKCIAGQVYELIEDFDRPQENEIKMSLAPVRKALLQSVEAILERPQITLQTVYNYLVWQNPLPQRLMNSLALGKNELDKQNYWIRSSAPLPEVTSDTDWQIHFNRSLPLQSLSSDSTHVAASDVNGNVNIYNLQYGKLIEQQKIGGDRITSIGFCAKPWCLAWTDQQSAVHSTLSSSPCTKICREPKVVYHPQKGVVFVSIDSELVCWTPGQNQTSTIISHLPTPLQVLRFVENGQYILFAAGLNPTSIGLIKWKNERWETSIIENNCIPLVDLDFDVEQKHFLLLHKNRSINIINLDGKIIAQTFYELESKGQITGAPAYCTFGKNTYSGKAFFVVSSGKLFSWDWQNRKLESFSECFSNNNPQAFRYLSLLPDSDNIFYSTDLAAGIISQQLSTNKSIFHRSAILDCAITSNDHVVTAGKEDNSLKWFSIERLNLISESTIPGISAICSFDHGEQVFVGNNQGKVWIQEPNLEKPDDDLQLQVFLGGVKEIIFNSASSAYAADAGGAVRFVDFSEESVNEIRHYSGVGKLIRLVSADPEGQFWSLCSEAEKGDVFYSLEFWKNSQKEIIDHSPAIIDDFDIDKKNKALFKVFRRNIETLQFESEKWNSVGKRLGKVLLARFVGNNGDLIAVIDHESSWLEIWKNSSELETVAYAKIPEIATCLATHENRIVIGCESGKIISYTLEGEKHHAVI